MKRHAYTPEITHRETSYEWAEGIMKRASESGDSYLAGRFLHLMTLLHTRMEEITMQSVSPYRDD